MNEGTKRVALWVMVAWSAGSEPEKEKNIHAGKQPGRGVKDQEEHKQSVLINVSRKRKSSVAQYVQELLDFISSFSTELFRAISILIYISVLP